MSTVNLGRTYLDTHTHTVCVGEEGGSSGTATSFIMSSFMAQCATGFFLLSYAPTPKKTPETREAATGRRRSKRRRRRSGGSGCF